MWRLGEYFSQGMSWFLSGSRSHHRTILLSSNARRRPHSTATFGPSVWLRSTLSSRVQSAFFIWLVWMSCPSSSRDNVNSIISSGWGTTLCSGQTSQVLLEVILTLFGLCWLIAWRSVLSQSFFWGKKRIVIYLAHPIELICCQLNIQHLLQGNSGGPLLYQMSNGRWAVVDAVSFGKKYFHLNDLFYLWWFIKRE